MIVFPPAKINLGLNITGKRLDGFHNLQSIFFSVNLRDALEVVIDPNLAPGELTFTCSGIPIPGNTNSNLILRAAGMFGEVVSLPGMRVHLHKNIPMGAGMGGGSSDGTWMLRVLNELMDNPLSHNELYEITLKLGSDCPFFLHDSACYVEGRGEVLKEISLDLSGWTIILINPGIHISTAEAFAMITPSEPQFELIEVMQHPVSTWKGKLTNDFEKPACIKHPEIQSAIDLLDNSGAIYTAMTGSGSTVFGLFEVDQEIPKSPDHWFVYKAQL